MHRKLKKTQHGTKNLSKGAKSRVWVLADIQNFALRAQCVCTACMAFPLQSTALRGMISKEQQSKQRREKVGTKKEWYCA